MTKRVVVLGSLTASLECLKMILGFKSPLFDVVAYIPHQSETIATVSNKCIDLVTKRNIPIISLSELEHCEYDLGISLMFDKKLKPEIVRSPELGWINIHVGPLPLFRGSGGCHHTIRLAPIEDNWTYGVTMHYMDERLDTGPIIADRKFQFDETWNAYDLYTYSLKEIPKLFGEKMEEILTSGKILESVPQTGRSFFFTKKDISHTVDLEQRPEVILATIRSLEYPGKPGGYALIGGTRVYLSLSEGVG